MGLGRVDVAGAGGRKEVRKGEGGRKGKERKRDGRGFAKCKKSSESDQRSVMENQAKIVNGST